MLAVFHNEEVGSGTRQGADSTFLQDVLRRINGALGRGEEDFQVAVANSFLVSADNAHAVHPAHPEYADSNEAPVLGGGVVIKYNAAQRYTTDAVSDAVFRQICVEAGVPVQRYSNRRICLVGLPWATSAPRTSLSTVWTWDFPSLPARGL